MRCYILTEGTDVLPPIYGRSLFALVRALGITPQTVAHSLGVSQGFVALWVHGKTPLAHHHIHPLRTLVADAIAAAMPMARCGSMVRGDALHPASPWRQRRFLLSEYLNQWVMEDYHITGLVVQNDQRDYEALHVIERRPHASAHGTPCRSLRAGRTCACVPIVSSSFAGNRSSRAARRHYAIVLCRRTFTHISWTSRAGRAHWSQARQGRTSMMREQQACAP
jgi:hypothetical protein